MIIAIQCAGTKKKDAPTFRLSDGRRVVFVAHPEIAPRDKSIFWAHPDDQSDNAALTWRQRVEKDNRSQCSPLGLLNAFQLYRPPAYETLVRRFGSASVRILSAGWGLVRADYRLPSYDITFSSRAAAFMRRSSRDHYSDFNQIDVSEAGPIVFLGGKDYLPLFKALTRRVAAEKLVMFRTDPGSSTTEVHDDDFVFTPFATAAKTNWHYRCAELLCHNPDLIRRA